jgi:type I restriction enzyme R subunit
LFEQMLGRGTRKGERYPDKSHFVVVDCFDGSLLAYFRETTGITAEPPVPPSRTITEIIECIWQNKDREYNTRCLVKRLQRIDKEMSGNARAAFASHIPEGDVARFARDLPSRLHEDFNATMILLRNQAFQDLLVNYERKPRVFLVAHTVQDEVSSQWLVRGNDGKEYLPDDYLTAFTAFVREHENDIDAIKILLDRPQDWSPGALSDLRNKLAAAPARFTVENLQRAHELAHHKALVDIISMVKHAADTQSPLYTSAERVDRALAGLTRGRTFSAEQGAWLDRIRTHLQENLSIDKEDFDTMPAFSRYGGWSRANNTFNQTLPSLLKELNRVIAA